MSTIIQRIKNIAHEVSEGYLLFDNDMNEAILQKYNDGEIDNIEMLKRVCEQSNQNVYLAKFNNGEGRSNITFPIADFDSIKKNIDESEKSMELYDTPPEDFRSALELVVDSVGNNAEEEKTASLNKLSGDSMHEALEFRNRFAQFSNAVGILKTAAEQEMESGFNLMYHDAKRVVANNDSIGDMAKIACRSVMEDGMNPEGVMKAYSVIQKGLENSGFNVRNDFTKISSLKINQKSLTLRPVKTMAIAIEKIAALDEMKKNIDTIVGAFDKVLKANA